MLPTAPPRRIIVVPLIQNEKGQVLICKMPADRGVFPGQWGLPGGGIEEGERIEDALRREVREELGLELEDIQPLFFSDGLYTKSFPGGDRRSVYMIFLIFSCRVRCPNIRLNPEFVDFAWVNPLAAAAYDLNAATVDTLRRAGLLAGTDQE